MKAAILFFFLLISVSASAQYNSDPMTVIEGRDYVTGELFVEVQTSYSSIPFWHWCSNVNYNGGFFTVYVGENLIADYQLEKVTSIRIIREKKARDIDEDDEFKGRNWKP